MNLHKIIIIVGPTAVGKSDVALKLCEKLNGEIISCDSMQIYKEINIASNKPSSEVLDKIKHHLVNVVSVEEEFDVFKFSALANNSIKEVLSRNHVPVIVGGSGMYVQILLDGIFEGGPKNENLREILKSIAQEKGVEFLYEELKTKDPNAAAKIHSNDLRRIVRALEVYEVEDKPISELQKKREGIWGQHDIKIFALSREREKLYNAINARVDKMFEQGLVDEVKGLSNKKLSYTAEYIIGIPEIRGVLNGEYDLDHAKEIMKQNTRRLAKRQLTWFRKDKRLKWLTLDDSDNIEDIVKRIMEMI